METIWLSHLIENSTPLYGGVKGIQIRSEKSVAKKDSCNTSILEFPSHTGTHMDVPFHFFENGRTINMYDPEEFIFDHPFVLTVKADHGQLIGPQDFLFQIPKLTDLIMIQTGFEKKRKQDIYWESGPGLSPDLLDFFLQACPGLKAVGMDFISISSLQHREVGRKAHRAFLGKNILLIEDMRLIMLTPEKQLKKVIALPLRVFKGDGAPCTIVGFSEK